jgi:hypothetical protein
MKFAQIRTPAKQLPKPPSLIDYVTRVAAWPMYGNDRWGDCVWAMIAHSIEAATAYGQSQTVQVSEVDVLAAYSAVTGFDSSAGEPGSNPTDQGTVIQDALNYWRRIGVAGHKILAFAQVDHTDPDEVDTALWMFGHLQVGIAFPASAMDQFNRGGSWDVVDDDGGNEGGHAIGLGLARRTPAQTALPRRPVLIGRNDRGNYEVLTWGKVQEMTPAFFAKYVEECWAVMTPEWYDAQGRNPEGIDQGVAGEVFTALTGEPSPFQSAPECPTPVPAAAPAAVDPAPAVTLPGRHPGTAHLARYFAYDHLPEHLQAVSRPCGDVAALMIAALPDGPELTAGLRKLLEAKDCFVRAALPPKE